MTTKPIRRSLSLLRLAFHGADATSMGLAGVVAGTLRFGHGHDIGSGPYVTLLVMAAGLMVLASSAIYRACPGGGRMAMAGRLFGAWMITWGIVLAVLFFARAWDISRLWLLAWMGLSLVMGLLCRLLLVSAMARARQRGHLRVGVLVVGHGPALQEVVRRMNGASWTGYALVGTADTDKPESIAIAVARLQPEEVWISQSFDSAAELQRVLQALQHCTADVRLVPDLAAFQLVNHGVSVVMGIPMIDLSYSPMSSGLNRLVKALADRLLAAVILLLVSPVMIALAIGVKLSSPGPVLFKQRRHGWNGETIEIFKFRSMVVHQEHDGQVTQARREDARVTRLGRFMRRTSLDELPQFFNVLLGTMSIVGPRPHAVEHNQHFQQRIPRYMLRHKVKPGVTGWAQVNGLRGETDTDAKMEARVKADLHYIENWSVWMDLKIIALTVLTVWRDRNAY